MFYCNRLEQGFVVVCEAGTADYSERQQFNQLMAYCQMIALMKGTVMYIE